MEEVLHLEISGKFNGRNATLTINFDAESAFEIEEMDTSTEVSDDESSQIEQAKVADDESKPLTDSPDGSGLDGLFPDEENLPPLSPSTKQFKVAETIYDSENEWVPVREIVDSLQEREGEDEWDNSKVTSHLYSLMDKEILDRDEDEDSGNYIYKASDVGEKVITQAKEEKED